MSRTKIIDANRYRRVYSRFAQESLKLTTTVGDVPGNDRNLSQFGKSYSFTRNNPRPLTINFPSDPEVVISPSKIEYEFASQSQMSSTYYYFRSADTTGTPDQYKAQKHLIPADGFLTGLSALLTIYAGHGTTNVSDIIVCINGVESSLKVTFALAETLKTYSGPSIAVSKGDEITLKHVRTASGADPSDAYQRVQVVYEPSESVFSIDLGCSSIGANATPRALAFDHNSPPSNPDIRSDYVVIPYTGFLTDLVARTVDDVLDVGDNVIFNVTLNGSPTALEATMLSGTDYVSISGQNIPVTEGDIITITITSDDELLTTARFFQASVFGTLTSRVEMVRYLNARSFTDDSERVFQVLMHSSGPTLSMDSDRTYFALGGEITKIRITIRGDTVTPNVTFRLYKNEVATSMVGTLPSGETSLVITGSEVFAPGDYLNITCDPDSSHASLSNGNIWCMASVSGISD